jgi:hypothetical protein
LWRHDEVAASQPTPPKERTETELELPMSLIQLRRDPGAVSDDRLLSYSDSSLMAAMEALKRQKKGNVIRNQREGSSSLPARCVAI